MGPDLYAASQDAVRAMIDHLSATYGLSREDAYVLASLCVDLRISEVVDAGEYVVSALFPSPSFAADRISVREALGAQLTEGTLGLLRVRQGSFPREHAASS